MDKANQRLIVFKPVTLVIISVGSSFFVLRMYHSICSSKKSLSSRLKSQVFSWLRLVPSVSRKIDAELSALRITMESSIHECDIKRDFLNVMPELATAKDEILQRAVEYFELNKRFDVENGRVSGAVYTDMTSNHLNLLSKIFEKYAFSNPLHPDVFPCCRKMEAEIVRMLANIFNGSDESCGTMTSGGTESIILVCFASRNRALARGITAPTIIAPVTVHAAFEKAAHLLGIDIKYVSVDQQTKAVNTSEMERAVTSNTCLLVGSAPNFPTGTVDDIKTISEIGSRHDIPVHVDACLGGLLVAFAEEIGLNLPVFDFRLPGVTSISCDTHKYGYAPKGTSVILYRSTDYLHYQYFSVTDWPGGIYATPTLAGSRAGLNIALTWATLLYFGRNGYVQRAKKICDAAKSLSEAIVKIPGIELVGRVDVSVVAFRSTLCNIYAVSDSLNKLGWNLNTLQAPASIHFCLTYNHTSEHVLNEFVTDLQKVCHEIINSSNKGNDSHTASIYGMAAQIPDKSLVDEVAFIYLDSCYSMPLTKNSSIVNV